jgi:hypothetical protein
MTRGELEALIDAGNLKACLTRLEGMPEAKRAQLGAAAVARLKAIVKGVRPGTFTWLNQNDDFRLSDVMTEDPWSDTRAQSDVPQNLETFNTARAAVLATASLAQWKSVLRYGLPSDKLVLRILRDRRLTWLNEMVELICESDDPFHSRWNLIRGLAREGLSAPPKSGLYIDRMLRVLMDESSATERKSESGLAQRSGLARA